MWPRLGSSWFVSRWITVTIALSVIAAVDGGILYNWLSLAPSKVFHGQVWRLVTWPLIEGGPLPLLFTCLAIYKFGGELAIRWGDRRLRRFMLEIVIVAGVITCLLAAVAGLAYMRRVGGWVIMDSLAIAWARQFPNATLMLYGMVGVRGRSLINITIGFTVVTALFSSVIWMVPELVACLAVAYYPQGWLRR